MKDLNKNKRIKKLRKMQGLPTFGSVMLDIFAGTLLFAVILLGYLVIKTI